MFAVFLHKMTKSTQMWTEVSN